MTDPVVLAKAIADVRDAVARIRSVVPAERAAFERDRTAREVTVLNLFVALQQCLSIAAHWLAWRRLDVPAAYRDTILALRDRGVLDAELAERIAAATGLRNLIAHRYAALDAARIHEFATQHVGDLESFCNAVENASRA